MKKLVLLIIVVAFMAAPAFAVPTVVLTNSYGNDAGEFLVTPTDFPFAPASLGEVAGQFETFCLEKGESFDWGVSYLVEFNTIAINGGLGGQDSSLGDSLDVRTAYLYDQFITGALVGYNYTNTSARFVSADALPPVMTRGSPEIPFLPESGPNIGWVPRYSTESGRYCSIKRRGYTFTEQVSITRAPGLRRLPMFCRTGSTEEIEVQRKSTSHCTISFSPTPVTPGGTGLFGLRLNPFTVTCFARRAAQKAPNRPRPYTPISMGRSY